MEKEITQENIHTHLEIVTGKNIIISGGTTGIGRATALLLASYGANIFIFGRHKKELNDAIEDIKKGSREGALVNGIIADQSKEKDIEKIFEEFDNIRKEKLDIFINNAGLNAEGINEMDDEDWRYIINTNLVGYIACTKEAIKRMEKNKEGHIVFIGSLSADVRDSGESVYAATKAGMQGFAEALRKEVNPLGIKVSLIEPGKVGSDMVSADTDEQKEKQKNLEMLKAQDVAVAVHYCLTQPKRCDVIDVKIRPHMQLI